MCLLVLSHHNYSNRILAGVCQVTISNIQRVQNLAAKGVLNKGKFDSVSQAMKELHSLPVKGRIDFKILCIIYKCLDHCGTEYLIALLCRSHGNREGLRSADKHNLLNEPRVSYKTFATRSFSVYGVKVWSELPNYLQRSNNIDEFKGYLKTHLFKKFYQLDEFNSDFMFYTYLNVDYVKHI